MNEALSGERGDQDGSQSVERAALEALVEQVVGAAYEVSNVLGAGFLEKIYERALIEELGLRGIRVKAQAPFPIAYKGKHIGTYAADLVVDVSWSKSSALTASRTSTWRSASTT
jgi:PD-(D/E)XK nuclease superfamily